MIEYNNAKQNVDRLLGITHLQEKSREKEHWFVNEKLNRELPKKQKFGRLSERNNRVARW